MHICKPPFPEQTAAVEAMSILQLIPATALGTWHARICVYPHKRPSTTILAEQHTI